MIILLLFLTLLIGIIIGMFYKPNGDEIFDRIEKLDRIANGVNDRNRARENRIKKYRKNENKRRKVKNGK